MKMGSQIIHTIPPHTHTQVYNNNNDDFYQRIGIWFDGEFRKKNHSMKS